MLSQPSLARSHPSLARSHPSLARATAISGEGNSHLWRGQRPSLAMATAISGEVNGHLWRGEHSGAADEVAKSARVQLNWLDPLSRHVGTNASLSNRFSTRVILSVVPRLLLWIFLIDFFSCSLLFAKCRLALGLLCLFRCIFSVSSLYSVRQTIALGVCVSAVDYREAHRFSF